MWWHGWLKWIGLAWSKINYTHRRTRAGCWSWFFRWTETKKTATTSTRFRPIDHFFIVSNRFHFSIISIVWMCNCRTCVQQNPWINALEPLFSMSIGSSIYTSGFTVYIHMSIYRFSRLSDKTSGCWMKREPASDSNDALVAQKRVFLHVVASANMYKSSH